jgi:hypothetical protein
MPGLFKIFPGRHESATIFLLEYVVSKAHIIQAPDRRVPVRGDIIMVRKVGGP